MSLVKSTDNCCVSVAAGECECGSAWREGFDPDCAFHATFKPCHYCATLVDPEVCWAIFDTPVGAYEILLCDEHFADSPTIPSWIAAFELVNDHPVVHGD